MDERRLLGVALALSCALHAVAGAYLPQIVAPLSPPPPSGSLTMTVITQAPTLLLAPPVIEHGVDPRGGLTPSNTRPLRAGPPRSPASAGRSPTPVLLGDRRDRPAGADLDAAPATTASPALAKADSSEPGSPSPAPGAIVHALAGSFGGNERQSIEPPRFNAAYLSNPSPDYPSAARRLGLQGTVVLRVLVDATGHATELRVGQTSGASILDDVALTAVRTWRFVPARRANESIAHWVDVPVRFRLQD